MVSLGKRGISPLIATVLLIAFAVSIGAMVMNWGKDVVANTGDCNDVKLELQMVNGKPMFCYDPINTRINAMIKNIGSVDVERFTLRTITSDFKVDEIPLDDSSIKVGDVKTKSVNYIRAGKFRVEFVPSISAAGKEKKCSEKAIAIDDIPSCN